MTREQIEHLVCRRAHETCRALGLRPEQLKMSFDFGHYEHFDTSRGFGVTFFPGKNRPHPRCHLRLAPKLIGQPRERVDGIVRHELGHVVDLCFPEAAVDQWAERHGVQLPKTDERRADAIAELLWKEPIRYDKDLVQSTREGVTPRPRHLGL